MFQNVIRIGTALLLPLLLAGCLLTPGKFASTLTVNADRSFAFTCRGEVIALDLGKDLADGMKDSDEKAAKPGGAAFVKTALADDDTAMEKAARKAEFDKKCAAIAEVLKKEAGYKSVAYLGNGKFTVDYAIAGTLTHNFLYPFNLDAGAAFPFVAVELRADGRVRVKAPMFAQDMSKANTLPVGDLPGSKADGTFTLDTDAELVSQNNEAGATTVGGRKRIAWTVTPVSTVVPTAVLGLK